MAPFNRLRSVLTPGIIAHAESIGMNLYHCQKLAYHLRTVCDALRKRPDDRCHTADLGAYLRLQWMERNGGSLRLTPVGHAVCSSAALVAGIR